LRSNAERDEPEAAHKYAYISELYSSPRHSGLSPGIRSEQLQRTLLHYLVLLEDGLARRMDRLLPAPFVRDGRAWELPRVRAEQDTVATVGSPVASRRHEQDTPAVMLLPSVLAATTSVRPTQVQHRALYEESVAFVLNLLGQMTDAAAARSRLCAELQYLGAAAAKETSKLHARLDLTDESAFNDLARDVFESPFALEQLGACKHLALSRAPPSLFPSPIPLSVGGAAMTTVPVQMPTATRWAMSRSAITTHWMMTMGFLDDGPQDTYTYLSYSLFL